MMPDDPDAMQGTFERREIEYAVPDRECLPATVLVPRDRPGPMPAVVDIHGGTWVGGSRLSNIDTAEWLAARGVAVMAPDFRVPAAARYPEPIRDIAAAVGWLKAHADEIGTMPQRVGGIGFSSGAHQLMLLAMRPDDSRYRAPGPDARLAFVVSCWGVLAPVARLQRAERLKQANLVAGHAAYFAGAEETEEADPQLILESGAPVEMPPLLALQGDEDANLGPEMASRFAAEYRRRGGVAQDVTYPGMPHGFLKREPDADAAHDALNRILAFVRRYGGAGR